MRSAHCTILSVLVLTSAFANAACTRPRHESDFADVVMREEITAMFSAAARAWNRGDLDAFMSDYLPGDRTTYVGGRGLLHGTDAIRAAYAPRFAAGAQRDSLSFEGLEIDLLAPDVAHAIAFYVLSRSDSVTARGPTSLVLVRRDGRWRIVHDHSS